MPWVESLSAALAGMVGHPAFPQYPSDSPWAGQHTPRPQDEDGLTAFGRRRGSSTRAKR